MELRRLIRTYEEDGVKLDIGCGERKLPGYTGVDLYSKDADLRFDLAKPWPIEEGSVSTIHAYHVLEHFDLVDIHTVMTEIWKALEYDGCLIGIVPHGHSDLAIGDPQHKMRWLEWTPHRFCAQVYQKSGMGQGLPYKPWIIECVYSTPHPDFKDTAKDKERFHFIKQHMINVYEQIMFVMRKCRG